MSGEPFDEAAFATWLAGDPRRQPAFQAMWRRIMGRDMDAALHAYRSRSSSKRTVLASSAAVLLALAAGYKALPSVELQLAEPQGYTAAAGKVRKVRLEDGTVLTLAGGSDVKVRYTRHYRVVEMANGTVFVEVAPDANRRFRFYARNARIMDIGTSFEVSSGPAHVRIAVAEGAVEFGRDGWFDRSINLVEKQAATLDSTGLNRSADVSPDDIARWRSEWVEYKGASLRQVVADLQSLAPKPIKIADQALGKKAVSGRIRLSDPIGQLENLSIIHGFRVRTTDEALIISED